MESFAITAAQVARLAGALTADELSRHFNRHTDFLTQSEWSAKTRLGPGGLALAEAEVDACANRLCIFFDKPPDVLAPQSGDTFGDWADRLMPSLHDSLKVMRFHPATQAGSADSRHAADEVFQDARNVASLMHGRRRVISLVSPHSLFGFTTTVLAPNLQRLPVVDGRAMAPEELGELMAFGDILVATPTLWRYLIETVRGFPNNVMGLSFGEPLLLDLAQELRECGLGAMRELYGSTESGVIGWRDTPAEPFVLFDHWIGGGEGLVRIRPDGEKRDVLCMDYLEWQGERTFRLGGRRDGAVQIGAVNVFPARIGKVIAQHPDIADCTVRVAQRAGALGRLIAHITLKPGIAPNQDTAWAVDEWCRKELRPPERPRIYMFNQTREEKNPRSGASDG